MTTIKELEDLRNKKQKNMFLSARVQLSKTCKSHNRKFNTNLDYKEISRKVNEIIELKMEINQLHSRNNKKCKIFNITQAI